MSGDGRHNEHALSSCCCSRLLTVRTDGGVCSASATTSRSGMTVGYVIGKDHGGARRHRLRPGGRAAGRDHRQGDRRPRRRGLPASTIASFRLDLTAGPLPAGAIVILDEISQTSTVDALTVLAAVHACHKGELWILADPQEASSVKAGGIAAETAARANAETIPAARLTVNRRQVDPVDRDALQVLRCGDARASQQLRREHGWKHTAATPEDTRREMADAVTTDILTHGPQSTVALVVSHPPAEDLSHRIRRRLTTAGRISRPVITGPGWTSERTTSPAIGSCSTPATGTAIRRS